MKTTLFCDTLLGQTFAHLFVLAVWFIYKNDVQMDTPKQVEFGSPNTATDKQTKPLSNSLAPIKAKGRLEVV